MKNVNIMPWSLQAAEGLQDGPADARIDGLPQQAGDEAHEEASGPGLPEILAHEDPDGPLEIIEADLVPEDFEGLRDGDGGEAGHEGGHEGGGAVEFLLKDIVLEEAVDVVVEERVEALPGERSAQPAGVLLERTAQYSADFFQNGGRGDQLDSSFE